MTRRGAGAEDVGGTMIGGNAVDEDDPAVAAAGPQRENLPVRGRLVPTDGGVAVGKSITIRSPAKSPSRISRIPMDQKSAAIGRKRGVYPLEILDRRPHGHRLVGNAIGIV